MKTADDYRKDATFQELEAKLARLFQESKETWQLIRETFPAPPGMTWVLTTTNRLHLRSLQDE
jgi:hypothetical protein